MVAIAEAVNNGLISNCQVAMVISDKKGAEGLQKAKERNLETLVITCQGRTREDHDALIIAELKARNVELVCLAGYMRLLSRDFVRAFPNRILNIHPSLLPAFKGLDAQRQAFEYGVKVSGCTVHFVDEDLDHGAIIAQKVVQIEDNDTPETLSAKILEHEHAIYVEAVKKIVEENYEIVGRCVIFK